MAADKESSQQREVAIRQVRESDLSRIQEIYAHYVLNSAATFEETPPDEAEMGRRRAEVERCGLPYLVAEVDGRVVGYAYASPYRARSAYRFTVEDSIYVDRGFVGRGVGRALLAALLEECSRVPLRQVLAVIGDGEAGASVRLHEGFGFRYAGKLTGVGFKFGQWRDTIFMQLELEDGEMKRT